MAFQFNLYPTGAVSLYKPRLNNSEGVSAIIDRSMGITEHSLSGVALYIRSIKNFVNTTNVGTSPSGITSGFFESLGYFTRDPDLDPYHVSVDVVVSGVGHIYSKTTDLKTNDVRIKLIQPVSGTFNNTIFDKSVFSDPQGSYFTNIKLVGDGNIRNTYSGYLKGYFPGEVPIPISGHTVFNITDIETYPYRINRFWSDLGDIVVKKKINRPYNFPNNAKEYGIIKGAIVSKNFSVGSNANVIVSGNLSVYNGFRIDASSILTAQSVHESIIEMDTHNHDGVNSRRIQASGLNSTKPPQEDFTLNLVSGDMNVFDTLKGNPIGLSTSWEVIPIQGIDKPQQLKVFGDSLFIIGKNKAVEFGKPTNIIQIKDDSFIVGDSPSPSLDTGMGDEFSIYHFDRLNSSGGIEGIFHHKTVFSSKNPDSEISVHMGNGGIGDESDFDLVTYRKINHVDRFNRLNNKIYYTVWDDFENANVNTALSLYEYDPLNISTRIIGAAEFGALPTGVVGITGGIVPMTPFTLEDNWVMPFRIPVSGFMGFISYNPIYQFQTNTDQFITVSGLLWSHPSGYVDGDDLKSGPQTNVDYGKVGQRTITDFTYLNGSVYYLINDEIHIMNIDATDNEHKNRVRSSRQVIPGTGAVVAYAGKLWTGRALERSYDVGFNANIDNRLLTDLRNISDNTEPWLTSPVVYDGWLYALVPSISLTDWTSETFTEKYFVNYDLPAGSKLVRRRVAETDLAFNSKTLVI